MVGQGLGQIFDFCVISTSLRKINRKARNAGAFPRILGVLRIPGDDLDTRGLNELFDPTRPRKFSNNGEKRYIIYFTFMIFLSPPQK